MNYAYTQNTDQFEKTTVQTVPGRAKGSWRVMFSGDEVGRVGKIDKHEFVGSVIVSDTQYRVLQGTGVEPTLQSAAIDVVAAWCGSHTGEIRP